MYKKDCVYCYYRNICRGIVPCELYEMDDSENILEDEFIDEELDTEDDMVGKLIERGRIEFRNEWFKYTDEDNI